MKSKQMKVGHLLRFWGGNQSWNFNCILLWTITSIYSCTNPTVESKNVDESLNFDEALAIPDFNIALVPDSSIFSISSTADHELVLIKFFSPDCDHCQEEAKALVSKKDSLQNIKTLWIAGEWANLKAVEEFAEKYQIGQLNPLAIGKDASHDLAPFYGISGVPFTAVYRGNQLLKQYTGAVDFSELVSINNGTYVPEPVVDEPAKEELSEEAEKS